MKAEWLGFCGKWGSRKGTIMSITILNGLEVGHLSWWGLE